MARFSSAEALARHLRTASASAHGTAARAFLQCFVGDLHAIRRAVKENIQKFLTHHVPEDADGQVHRVAQRFGLIAAGGELAVAAGVLPWPAGEATSAAARCFTDWLAARGGTGPLELRTGVAQVRSFLLAHGMSRFVPAWESEDMRVPTRDIAGFRKQEEDGWDYYVTTSAWRDEVCAGMHASTIAAMLADGGMLVLPGTGSHRAKSINVPGHGKLRVYTYPRVSLRPTVMTDWSAALAHAFNRHLQNGGSTGSGGSMPANFKPAQGFPCHVAGTTSTKAVVPVVPERPRGRALARLGTTGTTSAQAVVPGPIAWKEQQHQSSARIGTTGTTGTTENQFRSPIEPELEGTAGAAPAFSSRAEWASGVALLYNTKCPGAYGAAEWTRLLEDAAHFLCAWDDEAARLGWTTTDLFGVHPQVPRSRFDAMGLVPLIKGGEVIALTADHASIRMPSGTILTYLRRPMPEAIAIWALVGS